MIRAPLLVLLLLIAPTWAQSHDRHLDSPAASADDHGDDHDHDDHDDDDDDDDHDDDHLAEVAGIRAVHAWTNATAGASTLVFVEIENRSEATVTLLGARSDIAASARLVALENVGGSLRYADIPQLPVAPGARAVLAPNGLAVQLDGLSQRLEQGGHFGLALLFEGVDLPLTVEVESASATRHSHAGHAH